jgi:hypothetical protein
VPNALKAVIAFNIIAAVLIWLVAYGYGGGFTGGLLRPSVEGPPMRLDAVAPRAPEVPSDAVRSEPPPPPATGPDAPAPWTVQPDGSIRFSDEPR